MKILTPFKSVPDPYAQTTSFEPPPGTKWVVNPFDEIAIEEALRIKERGEADEVVCVTIGPTFVEEQVRSALAMGVDRAILVSDARLLDSFAVARVLEAVVKRERPQLVLMGKQAVDDDANQAGQMLAGLLAWPQATFVSKLEFVADDPQTLVCTRETDSGLEVIEVTLPAVVTTDLRLNEPRYVSLPGLMRARRREIEVIGCAELNVKVEPATIVLESNAVPVRPAGAMVASISELVEKLRTEAKAL